MILLEERVYTPSEHLRIMERLCADTIGWRTGSLRYLAVEAAERAGRLAALDVDAMRELKNILELAEGIQRSIDRPADARRLGKIVYDMLPLTRQRLRDPQARRTNLKKGELTTAKTLVEKITRLSIKLRDGKK